MRARSSQSLRTTASCSWPPIRKAALLGPSLTKEARGTPRTPAMCARPGAAAAAASGAAMPMQSNTLAASATDSSSTPPSACGMAGLGARCSGAAGLRLLARTCASKRRGPWAMPRDGASPGQERYRRRAGAPRLPPQGASPSPEMGRSARGEAKLGRVHALLAAFCNMSRRMPCSSSDKPACPKRSQGSAPLNSDKESNPFMAKMEAIRRSCRGLARKGQTDKNLCT
jgi:hypothetical protein